MNRAARMAVLALAAVMLQGAALAQAPSTNTVTFHGLAFPASIAGAERFSVRDYEKDHPGLGYSVGYQGPDATSTIYVYDLRKPGIPDDPSAPVIKAEFEAARADIYRAQQRGAYLKVEAKDEFSVADGNNRPRLRCGAFRLMRTNVEIASHLCVGGWNNKFVKFRITGEQHSQADALRFLEAWTKLLWPS